MVSPFPVDSTLGIKFPGMEMAAGREAKAGKAHCSCISELLDPALISVCLLTYFSGKLTDQRFSSVRFNLF